jgi:hypothetical protein
MVLDVFLEIKISKHVPEAFVVGTTIAFKCAKCLSHRAGFELTPRQIAEVRQ